MNVYPAIDLLGGHVVRLAEGRRDRATIYSDRPGEVAAGFARAGARRLHVVDLDGAFAGRRDGPNLGALQQILAAGVPVQLGGGLRDLDTLAALLDQVGVERAVLGTAAVKSPAMTRAACRRWPGRIVIAVDARDGRVAVEGWVEATDVDATELAARMVEAGAAAILYTDIRRDGLGTGAAVEATAQLARALHPVEVIASGGVASLEDLRALARAGVPAAVVGRALYEGTFTVEKALAAGRAATVVRS